MRVRTIRDMAATVRGRRTDLKLSQAELAQRAGVSRKWISEFEAGKATAEFGLVLRVLDELGLVLDVAGEDTGAAGCAAGGSRRPRGVSQQMTDSLLVLLEDTIAGSPIRLPGGKRRLVDLVADHAVRCIQLLRTT